LAGSNGAKPKKAEGTATATDVEPAATATPESSETEAKSELKIVPESPADEQSENEEQASEKPADEPAANQKYDLKYKFHKGETVRWRVEHRSHVRTTVSGTTQTAESITFSVKKWIVSDVDEKGQATFEHSVESIQMRQKVSERQEVTYDSLTDKQVPKVFEHAASSVGIPLSVLTIDAKGKVTHRENKAPGQVGDESSQITLFLPANPVSIGEKWHFPNELDVPLGDGTIKKVQMRQQFTLTDVRNGIAILKLETQILTPIKDPAVEAQLMQRETSGEVRFDIEAGRIVGQQYDSDRQCVGFNGENSSLHCRTRFSESLLEDVPPTARKDAPPKAALQVQPVKAGPPPAPK
jgi:hypothetical protein